MATPFSEIYGRVYNKISDYSFLNLTQNEVEDILESYLLSSIVKFKKCKKDLSNRDQALKQFNEDLTDEEKEILATLMCVEYLTPKLITSELLKQKLSTKDYQLYSQANQIKEIREVRDKMKSEANQMMISYSYSENSLDDLL
ncbi:hypothetical protein [Anoxybacillus flavithermus]|uniref:Phage protein n=1 Tax=Anoxybacillus flavithermus TaxID=33934 RepID=A0A178TM83_9BACL|nr:hypothetical protein [Anoxybacillus flavithermus]OAO82585.1 hypothetical protein TAF16_0205 [Anoxybacillus flavithermus]